MTDPMMLQTIQSLNEMITKNTNTCDADCLMAKQKSDLKNIYLEAEKNCITAPKQLSDAEKNYFEPLEYSKILKKRYEKNAEQEMSKMQNEHNMIMKDIHLGIKNIGEQNLSYDISNQYGISLSTKSNDATAVSQNAYANQRMIFYIEKKIEDLSWWYYLLKLLFWICFIVWILVYVFYYRQFNTRSGILFIFILTYPFYMVWIITSFISLCAFILNLFPTDVYLNTNS